MRARTAIPAAVALIAVVAPSARAQSPLIEDPKGDHPVAVADIVSADMTTTRGGNAKLVITMTLAAAPSTSVPHSYRVEFVAGECRFQAVYFGHPLSPAFNTSAMGCDDGDNSTPLDLGNATVSGATITWSVPLGGDLRRGVVVTDIAASTEPGGLSTGTALQAAGDTATTDKSYRIGT